MQTASKILYCLVAALSLGGPASVGAIQAHSVVVGRDSTLLRSIDGQSFAPVCSPANGYVFGVVSDNSGTFVAVGSNGLILRPLDGGTAAGAPLAEIDPHRSLAAGVPNGRDLVHRSARKRSS